MSAEEQLECAIALLADNAELPADVLPHADRLEIADFLQRLRSLRLPEIDRQRCCRVFFSE